MSAAIEAHGSGDPALHGRAPDAPATAWRAYLAFAAAGARQEIAAPWTWVGRLFFYLAIVLIFSQLWKVVFADRLVAIPGATAASFIWYLALTEWATLSTPQIWLDIEADVRSGDIVHRLPRPVSYLGSKTAEALGALVPRFVVLGAGGAAVAFTTAGGLPADASSLGWAFPLAVLAALVQLVFLAAIGLSALWLHEAAPVYWIWQKCVFLLGGLMLPLEIYPTVVREFAYWTPFAPVLHGVGRMAFGVSAEVALESAVLLLFWGAVGLVALALLYRRALRTIEIGGG